MKRGLAVGWMVVFGKSLIYAVKLMFFKRKKHGVWEIDPKTSLPTTTKPHYFKYYPNTTTPINFSEDCYLPFIKLFINSIKSVDPSALVFFEPIPNEDPPVLSYDDSKNSFKSVKGLIYAPHWYDLYTMFTKSFEGKVTHDVQSLSRVISIFLVRLCIIF